jgi:hypothetical protein
MFDFKWSCSHCTYSDTGQKRTRKRSVNVCTLDPNLNISRPNESGLFSQTTNLLMDNKRRLLQQEHSYSAFNQEVEVTNVEPHDHALVEPMQQEENVQTSQNSIQNNEYETISQTCQTTTQTQFQKAQHQLLTQTHSKYPLQSETLLQSCQSQAPNETPQNLMMILKWRMYNNPSVHYAM